jgi:very-short-patch-repair endonuclease
MDNTRHMISARMLRQRQTEAEKNLWSRLRNKQFEGAKFRRQQPIGNYIVDFACLDKNLVIEIDGGQHNEEQAKKKDEQRTTWLEKEGYKVLRFWNNDILQNADGVLMNIQKFLILESHPHLTSPLKGEE